MFENGVKITQGLCKNYLTSQGEGGSANSVRNPRDMGRFSLKCEKTLSRIKDKI